jgi:integrase
LANHWFVEPLHLDPDWNTSSFASVNKWIKTIKRRGDSRATKESYFKCLATFVRATGIDPDHLVNLSSEKAKEAIQGFCDGYVDKKQHATAHLYLNYLRSFLKHNGKKDVDLEDLEDYTAWKGSKRPERVPTKDEVYRMAEVSDLRDRGVLLCDFQSGLRNATLRALTYGDIKDQIESDAPIICVHVTPQLKERVPEACKENVEQFTFFGKKATEALRLYLEERKRRYGPIGDEEPLFRSHSNIPDAAARSQPITEDTLQRLVKKAARKAGIKEWKNVRFHSLRKTFKAVLDAGLLGGGQLAEDDKEYLMGHVLPSQKAPYHNANVQVLQERYSKLDWGGEPSAPSTKYERLRQYARDLGFDPDRMIKEQMETKVPRKAYKGRVPSDEEKRRTMMPPTEDELTEMLQVGLRQRLAMSAPRQRTEHNGGTPLNAPYETRIVREEELVPLLDHGWDVVRELASGKIIIRRPNGLDE